MLKPFRFSALFAASMSVGIAAASFAQVTAERDASLETADDLTISALIDLADSGNADARNELGERYLQGHGVQQSYSDARTIFEKASMASNHAGAQYNLGLMYENGEGVPKSCWQALEWFRLAATQNYGDAGQKVSTLQSKLSEESCEASDTLAPHN